MSKVVDLRGGKKARPPAKAAAPVRKANERSRRESPARTRRLKMIGLKTGFFLILVVGFISAASALTYLPSLLLARIDIAGVSELSPALVRAAADTAIYDGSWFVAPDNLLFLPKEKMHIAVAALPRVKEASISRSSMFAQAVTVTVKERVAYADWCVTGLECYLMDEGGFIFAHDRGEAKVITTVFSGGIATGTPILGTTFGSGHFHDLVDLAVQLRAQQFQTHSISLETGQDFSAALSNAESASSSPFSLRATIDAEMKTVVRNLQLALQSDVLRDAGPLDYIDLRFGNRVYFKAQGAITPAAASVDTAP